MTSNRKAPRRIRLFHWRPAEAEALIHRLREAGYEVVYSTRSQSPSVVAIREMAPVAVVIDLTRLPSHGRYVGAWVRGSKSTRDIPLVFVGGDPKKVEKIRGEMPDAVYTSHERLVDALAKVKPVKDPVVPRQIMQTDPARTAAQKMGIKKGMAVALIDPPPGYAQIIGKLPPDVELRENPDDACPVTLWFVHEAPELESQLSSRRRLALKSRLWILWQKGRRDGLNGNLVREKAVAMGLVDYKICSLDGVWSGMVFTVKRARI